MKQIYHLNNDTNNNNPSTPAKFKSPNHRVSRYQWHHSSIPKLTFWSLLILSLLFLFLHTSGRDRDPARRSLSSRSRFVPGWEKHVRNSAKPKFHDGISVIVTGAAGFIGSHVSLALKKRGDGVVGLDNFNDYYDPELKRDRQEFLDRAGVFVIEGDVNDQALLRKLFDVFSFSHVMHLAAQVGVRYGIENPGSYVHSNIAGFVSLLEVCKGVKTQPAVVWASSSSVYGLNSKVPFSERDRTDQPASLYAATKKASEEIAHSYSHIYGLSLTGLRFFTVYGPWGRPDMAYFFFTRDILEGNEVLIYEAENHGTVARDFTYIDDVVKGCLGALDTAGKSTGSGGKKRGTAPFRLYNLGNTFPVPVSELVSILEKLLKVKAKRHVEKLPHGDVQFTHANISLAHRELGYQPMTDLQTGLSKFVRWYLDYYSDENMEMREIVSDQEFGSCS